MMMKKMIFTTLIFMTFQSFAAISLFLTEEEKAQRNLDFSALQARIMSSDSGADIIGNGSGIAELNMSFAFRNLDRAISYCINLPNCGEGTDKLTVLKLIRNAVLEKRDDSGHLVFLSKESFEEYLSSTSDSDNRVAKTGFSTNFPIYFNLGEIEDNNLNNDLSSMVAILTHELGHQVGVASHSFLNELAAEVRTTFLRVAQTIDTDIYDNHFSLSIIGGINPYDIQQVLLTVENEPIKISSLASQYKCSTPDSRLVGIKISGVTWDRPSLDKNLLIMKSRGNVDFFCEMKRNQSIITEEAQVEFSFRFSGELYPGNRVALKYLDQKAEIKR